MEQILEQSKLVSSVLPSQALGESEKLSLYCLRIPVEEGELWYHNLTGELLLLDYADLGLFETEGNLKDELSKRWFLVPKQHDEKKLADQIRTVKELLKPQKGNLNHYVVFTTTDCNARCFYCYELGRRRMHMTDAVAHDVAAYIAKNCGGKPVKILWFGGEPLFNHRAIDIITKDLVAEGVEFTSTMASNGFLFDEAMVKQAVSEWNLSRIQIALDGTEAIYNRSKAYIYRDGSPFQRVMSNIGLLLESGVNVSIRLNMDAKNADDLDALVDELAQRYQKYTNLSVYAVLLRDFGHSIGEFESWEQALSRYKALQERLINMRMGHVKYLERDIRFNQCMADNDSTFTILPDGRVGKCEHESEEGFIGSIYEDSFDQDMIGAWKEQLRIPECDSCLQYPTCIRLKKCAWHAHGCTEHDRAEMRINLTQKVLNEYERYKSGKVKESLV
ncbi:MAG: 4Fe-4S cluster-binding domain-containing protein [Atopobiaceae bacterium]|nr:4Fe-4S cluster-binding domain-containing protein [Atopobiaceae bacterium]